MSILDSEENHLATLAADSKDLYDPYGKIQIENQKQSTLVPLQLFDLPWEDVLIPKVTCYLTTKDIFKLRRVSSTAKQLAEAALRLRKELNLSFVECKNITATFNIFAQNCHRLECLQLIRCHWLTDELLVELLRHNKRLLELNFSDCINITAVSMQPVIVECKQLRKLELANCIWLTSGAIEALALHHSNLEFIDLSGCATLSQRSLILLFRNQNKLNTLALENVISTSNQVLYSIAKYCPLLQILNIRNCTSITDEGIQIITSQCKNLHSLLIKGCMRVNENILAPLRHRMNIDRVPGPVRQYGFYPNDFLFNGL